MRTIRNQTSRGTAGPGPAVRPHTTPSPLATCATRRQIASAPPRAAALTTAGTFGLIAGPLSFMGAVEIKRSLGGERSG